MAQVQSDQTKLKILKGKKLSVLLMQLIQDLLCLPEKSDFSDSAHRIYLIILGWLYSILALYLLFIPWS